MKPAVEEQLSLFLADLPPNWTPVNQAVVVRDEQIPHWNQESAIQIDTCDPVPSLPVSDCEWAAFLRTHGRVPIVSDERKPWEYCGWLLYYRMLLEGHPSVAKRWDYWWRTVSGGRLLDDPIPQIRFDEGKAPEAIRTVDKWMRLICGYESNASAVDKLADWFLWGFGQSKQPPALSPDLNERLYREVNLGPLLLKPFDYLGEWVAAQKGSWNPHAFFPTPHSLVEMMVRMTVDESEDLRSKTVCDPCVGSGRMLLHASNYSLRLYGMDIDPLMVKICKINGALYAPWILRSLPESFFHSRSKLEGKSCEIEAFA